MGRLSEYSPDELRVMFPPPSDDVFLSLISGAHSACLVRDASPYVGRHRSNMSAIASAYVKGMAL